MCLPSPRAHTNQPGMIRHPFTSTFQSFRLRHLPLPLLFPLPSQTQPQSHPPNTLPQPSSEIPHLTNPQSTPKVLITSTPNTVIITIDDGPLNRPQKPPAPVPAPVPAPPTHQHPPTPSHRIHPTAPNLHPLRSTPRPISERTAFHILDARTMSTQHDRKPPTARRPSGHVGSSPSIGPAFFWPSPQNRRGVEPNLWGIPCLCGGVNSGFVDGWFGNGWRRFSFSVWCRDGM